MEHIYTPKVQNVKLLDKFNLSTSSLGTLYLTTTHLIFVSDNSESKKELWILHMLVCSIEKPYLTTSGFQIRLFCSNFLSATFLIQREREAQDIYASLCELSKPKLLKDLFCFYYNPKGDVRRETGWYFHDLQAEYQRQGVPNDNWSLCALNSEYSLCATYPKHIFVPTKATKALVEGSARFRSRSRLPVLTYLHSNGAPLIRCAQPLVGISGVRSTLDEAYFECLRQSTPGASFMYVIDTRPAMNAIANRAGGKGYENEKFYDRIKFSFRGIENIHKMRNSLRVLATSVITNATMDGFMSELANSGWLKHIKAQLDASLAIVHGLQEGIPVVVHCSDGWDRTAQTCSLSCVILDGYYRTLQGFQALIVKDWLAFGHKFQDRCGHLSNDGQEVSPIFTQFLDAIWQLTHMFPQAFQFNEHYLVTIHEHAYSCQYGTFLTNCEKDRKGLSDSTYSLWGYLVQNADEFNNPLYDDSTVSQVLQPNSSPQNIRFWTSLYCRFEEGAHPRETSIDLLTITQAHTSSLEDHGRQLNQTISQVRQLISDAKAAGRRLVTPASAELAVDAISTINESDIEVENGSGAEELSLNFEKLRTKCQSSKII